MQIVIATMSHETNTFSPVVTDLARFSSGQASPPSGVEAESRYQGTASCVGGFLRAAEEIGASV
ncbi:MAG: microcystin degradation protein MlrC, partial [Gammaproteobacteria bacterium]|nr:microcystin degradation protein MlrC [Gammaproteobacteria bacterium]